MWNLKDKKVLITGGTKGIGEACVREFLALGAQVILIARNENEVASLEQSLIAEGNIVYGLSADVTLKRDRIKLADFVRDKWGALDILVNNAGTNIRKKVNDYDETEVQSLLDLNLTAVFEISRVLYPFLCQGKNASIINVASIAGSFALPTGSSPYSISKAGVIQMSKNLAVEWAKDNIRVNAVSPWFVTTPLNKEWLKGEQTQSILARTPLRRLGNTEEIASVIAFLAMDKSSYITGQNINIDGGMSVVAF